MHRVRVKWAEHSGGTGANGALDGVSMCVWRSGAHEYQWSVQSHRHRVDDVSGTASSMEQAKRLARRGVEFMSTSPRKAAGKCR